LATEPPSDIPLLHTVRSPEFSSVQFNEQAVRNVVKIAYGGGADIRGGANARHPFRDVIETGQPVGVKKKDIANGEQRANCGDQTRVPLVSERWLRRLETEASW